jgi:predicted enzyme related to lactoylglutathione lyase
MHKSRLCGFIIDCEKADVDQAATFWASALGLVATRHPATEEARYRTLTGKTCGLDIEVQSVDHASRVHLDIETDDVEAEVQRLEKLGASQVGPVRSWVVMQAPTGQRFCVVRAFSKDFDAEANRWP